MKKGLLFAVGLLFFFTLAFYAPREASAVPAFARQTGMACNACHFQHFPTLNAFGRMFKSGGYTQAGGQNLVEGDLLSIPSTLNMSLITKVRYQKRNGDSQTSEVNKGQVQFPDEAALLIGGRGGEHLGLLLEVSLVDGDSRFTNFKAPIVFEVKETKLSAIPFTTKGLGASYGFELLATGALRNSRPMEHRTETSAQQYLGTDTDATGIALVASNPIGFVNYTAWSNTHGSNATGPYLNYFRAAATPTVAGWDLGAGVQVWNGTSKRGTGAAPVREKADAWAVDAQAQGSAGEFPLGVYASYASAAKTSATGVANIFNSNTAHAKSAWALAGELGVIPNRLSVTAGYRAGRNGSASFQHENATTVGLAYVAIQNLELQLNHSWYTGDAKPSPASGNMLTTLMLFAAF